MPFLIFLCQEQALLNALGFLQAITAESADSHGNVHFLDKLS